MKQLNLDSQNKLLKKKKFCDLRGKSFFSLLIISKDSIWKGNFDIFMVLLAVYSTFSSSYAAAFGLPTSKGS